MTKIALVVLDTLRKDTFDEYFQWIPGKRFDNAWSTSHWTTPAHVSLFTGEYPSNAGAYARSHRLSYEGQVLAEQLKELNYGTRAFSANPHIAPYFDFDRGFEWFEQNWHSKRNQYELFPWADHIRESPLPLPGALLSGAVRLIGGEHDIRHSIKSAVRGIKRRYGIFNGLASGADEALEFVRRTDFAENEFLFINLMETHTPYRPPQKFSRHNYTDTDTSITFDQTLRQNFSENSRSKQAYEDCANYLSHMLKKIYSEMEEFDYIYTLSDHGELFGEHGMWLHWYGLYPELTHVPLIVSSPEATNERFDAYVNLIDVYESVIDIARNDGATASNQLLGEVDDRVCFTEYHGLSHEWRAETLRESGVEEDQIKVYDKPKYGLGVAPDYYGYETQDGYVSEGTADDCDPEELLQKHRPDPGSLTRSGSPLDENIKDHLSDLGYV